MTNGKVRDRCRAQCTTGLAASSAPRPRTRPRIVAGSIAWRTTPTHNKIHNNAQCPPLRTAELIPTPARYNCRLADKNPPSVAMECDYRARLWLPYNRWRPMTRTRGPFLLSLATLAAFALHLPFAARTPSEGDVANYLLAIDSFNLQQHRPHPPGYPLYVLAGRALAALTGDPHHGLVALSALFAALALPAVWLLARRYLPAPAAAWAAVLAGFAPLTCFYGCVGLSGIAELAFTPLVLWLLHRAATGERRALWLAAVALGIAGGFRPNLLPFLLPAWLLTACARHLLWRDRLLGAAALTTTVAAWFVPTVIACGGWSEFRTASTYIDSTFEQDAFVLSGQLSVLAGNGLRALSAITLAIGPAGVLGLLLLPRLRRGPRPAGMWLLAVPIATPLLFFACVYFHKKAYALVLTAPLTILALLALRTLGARRMHTLAATSLGLGLAAWLLLPAEGVLLQREVGRVVAHEQLPAGPRLLRHWLMTSYASLRERDRRITVTDAAIATVVARHPTVVLVVRGDQPYDARTLMQRWPQCNVWTLPATDSLPPSYGLAGQLHISNASVFLRVQQTMPCLWLDELVGEGPELTGEIVQGELHRLVLRLPG
jgi:hypothetical protein